MKLFRLALLYPIVALFALRAQDDQQQKPPEEPPDSFSNLDEYIYTPKSNLNFGARYLIGVKTRFGGNGMISAPEALPDATAANISRTYHDGVVSPDARTMTIDNGDGTSSTVPIVSDGKTNTWTYDAPNQLTASGYMQFNLYSAQTLDGGFHDKDGKGTLGMELSTFRDMGNLGKHFSWRLFVGMSVNDIQAANSFGVKASVTTVTDTYDLYGQTPPPAPYTAPSSTTQNIVDSNGNQLNDVNGNPLTQTVDTTTLLSNAPLNRSVTMETDATSVLEQFKLHGAFVTFRAGPTLIYNLTDHFKFLVSAGPALIYSGSNFFVNAVLTPATGAQIIDEINSTESKLLLGYYGDATLQYDITDRTGIYFGAYFQNAGSYVQTATGNGNATGGYGDTANLIDGSYTTKVGFNDQEGIRTGLSFKF